MCCFTGPVRSVANTRIFARNDASRGQFIAYQMSVDAAEPVAMVLPLPVAADARAAAVRFIDLHGYPKFFDDLDDLWPRVAVAAAGSWSGTRGGTKSALPVERVGAFEASYVPSFVDFTRLDQRFRLPATAWTALESRYRDFGFAVFQLHAGGQRPHPMAFRFVRAARVPLFFPTVHVHDGTAPEQAEFDHTLYAQTGVAGPLDFSGWEESPDPASDGVKIRLAENLIVPDQHVYRRSITGSQPNHDTQVSWR